MVAVAYTRAREQCGQCSRRAAFLFCIVAWPALVLLAQLTQPRSG